MTMKKGQSSLEYLMTYGWAILVILIVGVLLWQMGVLGIGKSTTSGKSGFSQIRPLDWYLKSTGELSVVLINDAGTILKLESVSAELQSGGKGICGDPTPTLPIEPFRPAQSVGIKLSNCPVTSMTGDYYRANVTISYYNPASGLPHTSVGLIWGPIE